jgi:hypothetical protein
MAIMTQNQFIFVEVRLQEIAQQIAALQKEADELEIAKRVFQRFAGGGAVAATDDVSSKPKPRPVGIPTNFDMVELVLSSAEKEGKDGLTAAEVVQAIAARYWPGLVGEQILPSIYGFAKNGRLKKLASGKFKRIKKNEGPANESAEP